MAPFLRELEQVFGWLLAASWQASVLALFVLLIQKILGSRLNPRWRYALWLLVLLRLVLPVLPESALSLFQFAPPPPAALAVSVTEPLFVAAPVPSPSVSAEVPEPSHPFSAYSLIALIWLAGAVILLVLTWQVNRRFALQVANSPAISDPELLKRFAEAKAELGIRRPIRLIENGQVQSPAIMGLFQPTLLLPADVREKFDARELRFIFLHELAHLKRGDVIVQGLIALLQILHWFNPVLWFAFRRMRIDREPATDALVLSRTGEEEKERYGLMLIKLLEHFNQRHSLPTLVGILEDKDQFKRRFSLIARFTRGAYGWSLLGVLLISVLSVACLTKSKAIEAQVTANASTTPMSDAEAKQKGIAALVNNKPIFWSDIISDPIYSRDYLTAKASGNDLELRLVVQEAIDRELVIQDAESSGYHVPQSDLDERVNYGVRGFGGDKDAFVENLERNGSSLEQFMEQNRRSEIYSHMFILKVDGPTKTYVRDHPPAIAAGASPEVTKKVGDALFQTESTKLDNDWMAGLRAKAVIQTFADSVRKNSTSLDDEAEVLTVRTFLVPYGFFATKTNDAVDMKRELIGRGIEFSPGATVTYLPAQDKLVVRNTPEQLDKIVTLIETFPDATAQPKTDPASATETPGTPKTDLPPPNDTAKDLDTLKQDLLAAKEDADARRVLVDGVKDLPDDQFVSTLAGLGRADPNITALQTDITNEKGGIESLIKSGFEENHPRIQALRANLAQKEQQMKDLIAGMRRVIVLDAQMGDSRVTLLTKEATEASPAEMPITPTVPPAKSGDGQELDDLKRKLLDAKEDADARHVLLDNVKNLPDDQFVSTLQGLGRTDPNITTLQTDIAKEKGDIDNLLKSGFDENHPRIQTMRAELVAKQLQMKDLIAGIHRAMAIDLQMADSRATLLNKEVADQAAKIQPDRAGPATGNSTLDQALLGLARDGRTDKVGKGDADKIGSLLVQGADPNAKDQQGTTALVWALNFGKDDAAQILIQHGADGSVEDSNGENAAWLAAKIYYCPGALDLMIKKGVKVTGLNKQGRTIFAAMMTVRAAQPGKMNYLNDRVWTDAEFQAYEERERRTIELLIAAGADFNGKDGSKTPLMSAIQSGHAEAIRELLEHGADTSFKDAEGNTALSLAQAFRPELVPILEAHAK